MKHMLPIERLQQLSEGLFTKIQHTEFDLDGTNRNRKETTDEYTFLAKFLDINEKTVNYRHKKDNECRTTQF